MNPKMTDLSGPAVIKAIGAHLQGMGGVLRCHADPGHEIPLGDTSQYVTAGWPRCCGQMMTWRTARELEIEIWERQHGRRWPRGER